LPHDQNAARLNQQTFTLAEFLTRKAPKYRVPLLRQRALVHGHCHHKSLLKMNADQELLRRMQVDFELLDSGCCGMAGGFGFEKGDHYDVSIKCGERVLLPRARATKQSELLITDGFSCHEQVLQQTGKKALHLAQVVEMAIATHERETPNRPQKPEAPPALPRNAHNGHHRFRPVARAGAAALAALAFVALARSEKLHR
jgi:Fe-S oxidoreductase